MSFVFWRQVKLKIETNLKMRGRCVLGTEKNQRWKISCSSWKKRINIKMGFRYREKSKMENLMFLWKKENQFKNMICFLGSLSRTHSHPLRLYSHIYLPMNAITLLTVSIISVNGPWYYIWEDTFLNLTEKTLRVSTSIFTAHISPLKASTVLSAASISTLFPWFFTVYNFF